MRNWLRRLFGLHVHEWGETNSFEIGGQEYDSGQVHIRVGRRTMYWQECETCGRRDFVYPGTVLRIKFRSATETQE